MFSIFDVIGNDNLDYVLVDDTGYRKLQVPPSTTNNKSKSSLLSNHELTAATAIATATETATKYPFSVYDAIGSD